MIIKLKGVQIFGFVCSDFEGGWVGQQESVLILKSVGKNRDAPLLEAMSPALLLMPLSKGYSTQILKHMWKPCKARMY